MTIETRFKLHNLNYGLICGDSKKEIINLDGVHLIIGSPPYANLRSYDTILVNDYVKWFDDYIPLIYNSLSDNGVFVLNINSPTVKGVKSHYPYQIVLNMIDKGFIFIDNIIWNKGKGLCNTLSKKPMSIYENCFVFAKGLKYTWNPDSIRTEYSPISINRMKYKIPRRFSRYNIDSTKNKKTWSPNPKGTYPKNIINIGSESQRVSDFHTSVYPIKLVDWFIKAFTNPKDLVVDLWGGSGTTLISSVNNKRKCISIEIYNQFYFDSLDRIYKVFNI